MTRSILSILDVKDEIHDIINLGIQLKNEIKKGKEINYLNGKTLGLIFERPSTRTRVSFEVGMTLLGGHAIFLNKDDIQLGRGETIEDTALVLSRYLDVIMYRSLKNQDLHELAKHATVPVINGLDQEEHPCQILADLMTIKEKKGRFEGLNFVFIGDGDDNLTHSYLLGCSLVGMNVTVISPKKYFPKDYYFDKAKEIAVANGRNITITDNINAVSNTDVLVTDTWISLWYEDERKKRIDEFQKYRVTNELMKNAKSDAIFMHCMPIFYEEEVEKEVAQGPQSVIIDEAENRMWAQMALLVKLLC
jgi:ornithine carbamoyltransferase